jgi:tetratricopeptide (TPR) repeat protein
MMKRAVVLFAAVLLAALAGCAGTPEAVVEERGEGLSLDEGIAQIAEKIEAGYPAGHRVAVVNFQSPSAYFSNYMLKELQIAFNANKHLNVLDRANLELRRKELNFQMSGEVSDKSAVGIGHALGAQVIITGDFTDIGGLYRCRFYAIDVRTTEQVSAAVTVRRDRTVAFMLPAEAAPPELVAAQSDPALVAAYFNSGFARYEAGHYAEAVAIFTNALELRGDDEDALRYRALSHFYNRNADRAAADITRLIEIQPGNAEHYLLRAAFYGMTGKFTQAIADCNEAIRLSPNLAAAYSARGMVYAGRMDFARARADFEKALQLNPDDPGARNGFSVLDQGEKILRGK